MTLSVTPVHYPEAVREGDRLGPILLRTGAQVTNGDVVVVSSKAVAKAEGRVVDIDDWHALIEAQAVRVLRRRGELTITETAHGFVCANAGIDRSNIEPGKAVLLPTDPDRSAHVLRNELRGLVGLEVAIVVSDTFGRAWRNGVTDVAIGCAGLRPIDDLRGTPDIYGNTMAATEVCVADQIAGAAALVMGKSDNTPFAIVSGIDAKHLGDGSVRTDIVRHPAEDLFR